MRTSIFVRVAEPNDWPSMAYCFKAAGKHAWSEILPHEVLDKLAAPDRWHEGIWTNTDQRATFVAETEGEVIGFAVIAPSADEDAPRATGEIDAMFTDPRFWGRGAGQMLMDACMEQLKSARYTQATLWTEERNARARRFYTMAGWREDGTVRQRDVHGHPITEVRYRFEF